MTVKADCVVLFPPPPVQTWSEVAQSCLTLSDPMDCSLPGSSVHGIFQARVLEWGAIAFSGKSLLFLLNSYNYTYVSSTSIQFSSVIQSCPTLCDPMDCSLPGSSVHRIFQARVHWNGLPFKLPFKTSCPLSSNQELILRQRSTFSPCCWPPD